MRGTSANFWKSYNNQQTFMAASCMPKTPLFATVLARSVAISAVSKSLVAAAVGAQTVGARLR